MGRVGKHAEHFLLDVFRLLGKIDTVPKRLAHLRLAVDSGKTHARLILRSRIFGSTRVSPYTELNLWTISFVCSSIASDLLPPAQSSP